MEGNWPGAYRIHWPPLFPNLWLPECDYLQLDVTIRKAVHDLKKTKVVNVTDLFFIQ